MTTIVKEGDITTGSEGYNPTTVLPGTSTGTNSNVFIEGVGVVCQGDQFSNHTNGNSSHTPIAGGSLSKVYVGPLKKEVYTNTNPMSPGCGDTMVPTVGAVKAGS